MGTGIQNLRPWEAALCLWLLWEVPCLVPWGLQSGGPCSVFLSFFFFFLKNFRNVINSQVTVIDGCFLKVRGLTSQSKTTFCPGPRGGIKWKHKIFIPCTVIVAVQLLSRVRLFATPWTAARQASLSITISWSFLKLMSIESVMPSNRLILCRPLLLPPSVFPSVRIFSYEMVLCITWPEYWSFASASSFRSLCYSWLRIGTFLSVVPRWLCIHV